MSALDELLGLAGQVPTMAGGSSLGPLGGFDAIKAMLAAEKLGADTKAKWRAMVGQPDDPGTFAGGMARGAGQLGLDLLPTTPSEAAVAYAGGKALQGVGKGAGVLAKKFPNSLGMDVGSRLSAVLNQGSPDLMARFEAAVAKERANPRSGVPDTLPPEAASQVAQFSKSAGEESFNKRALQKVGIPERVRNPTFWDNVDRIVGNNRGFLRVAKPADLAELPVTQPGAKTGDPHALFAYVDDLGEGGAKRVMVNVFGDPENPIVKQLGWGSSVPLDKAEAAGLQVLGREPRSTKFLGQL